MSCGVAKCPDLAGLEIYLYWRRSLSRGSLEMVFLSYSHTDLDFVKRLSQRLIQSDVKVWRDEYKLLPGDSLTDRIRGAIDQASILCVVVSDRTFASGWIQQEIDAGLLREQQKAGFSVLPILIKDVQLPGVLGDRLWIDFRESFEDGLSHLLAYINRTSAADSMSGTVEDAQYFLYYAAEEGWVGGLYDLAFDIVSFDREERFCILALVRFRGNEVATQEGLLKRGIQSVKNYVLCACSHEFSTNPARVELHPNKPVRGKFYVQAEEGDLRFDAQFEVKMLGANRGETTIFNVGALFSQVCRPDEERK